MRVEGVLRSVLAGAPAVAAIVGDRIFPRYYPQGAALPLLVYSRISTVDVAPTFDGSSRLRRVRVQFSAWANTKAEVEDLGDAVLAALLPYVEAPVSRIDLANVLDLFEPDERDDSRRGEAVSLFVFHTEPIGI